MSPSISPRVAAYIAEHPGRNCGQCGTSWEDCTDKVLMHAGACCARCRNTDTHGANEAEAALKRAQRAPRTVTVTAKTLDHLARRLLDGDESDVRAVAKELESLAGQAVEPR